MSKLTREQKKKYGPRTIESKYGKGAWITALVRYDDDCGNGHNSFSITGEVVTPASKRRHDIEAGGMLHDDIARLFPELAPFLKWHLTSTDGPMHYGANTVYWLGYSGYTDGAPNSPPNLEHARGAAVWPDMPEDMLATSGKYTKADVEQMLLARLPALMQEFRSAVESLGFTY